MRLIEIIASKTYATPENAVKAVIKKFGDKGSSRFFIHTTPEGRFFPVFVGMQALEEGVHFNFNVVA